MVTTSNGAAPAVNARLAARQHGKSVTDACAQCGKARAERRRRHLGRLELRDHGAEGDRAYRRWRNGCE
jgi:ribosomal protein S14